MKTFKQLSYTQQLKWRLAGWWALLAVHIAYIIILSEMGGGDSRMQTGSAHAMSAAIGFGGIGWMAYKIHSIRKLLRYPGLRKLNMLSEHDERNRYLYDKSGGAVWDLQFVGLLAATFYASMFSMEAYHVTLPLLLLAAALKLGFWRYYSTR